MNPHSGRWEGLSSAPNLAIQIGEVGRLSVFATSEPSLVVVVDYPDGSSVGAELGEGSAIGVGRLLVVGDLLSEHEEQVAIETDRADLAFSAAAAGILWVAGLLPKARDSRARVRIHDVVTQSTRVLSIALPRPR